MVPPMDGFEPLRFWIRLVGLQIGFAYLALEAMRPPRPSRSA